MTMAMLCAAAITALLVGANATRDALFLTSLNFTALPTMLIAASAFSIALIVLQARTAARFASPTLIPMLCAVSGVLFLCEWATRSAAPAATAVIVFLHVSGAAPLLASGVWLMTGVRFDPQSPGQGLGKIAAAGILGGLIGAVVAERVAALLGLPAMLPFLAGFQFLTAWLVWRLAVTGEVSPVSRQEAAEQSAPLRAGLQVVAESCHLRQLALLVLLGTTAAALVDYLFKANAVQAFGPGDNLLRFFAVYYAATNLIAFVLQAVSGRAVLGRFGLALTTSTPSIALLAGSIWSLAVPGFGGLVAARAGESIFRTSWFRAGCALFYRPVPAAEKRAAKTLIDVTFARLGDGVGGGLVRIAIVFLPAAHSPTILVLAIASSLAAIVVATMLNRWYLRTLETSRDGMGPLRHLAPSFDQTRVARH